MSESKSNSRFSNNFDLNSRSKLKNNNKLCYLNSVAILLLFSLAFLSFLQNNEMEKELEFLKNKKIDTFSSKHKRFVTRTIRDHIIVQGKNTDSLLPEKKEEKSKEYTILNTLPTGHLIKSPDLSKTTSNVKPTQPPHLSVEIPTNLCGCPHGISLEINLKYMNMSMIIYIIFFN